MENRVVNEANECLHPFLSITHSQIHSAFPSYFPDSCLLPPSCSDQAFHSFPATCPLPEQHLSQDWCCHLNMNNGDRLPSCTIWAAEGKTQAQEKQKSCSFHTQGLVEMNSSDKQHKILGYLIYKQWLLTILEEGSFRGVAGTPEGCTAFRETSTG